MQTRPGRPKENPAGQGKGNPQISIRFRPSDFEQVMALGGARWAKPILLAALAQARKGSAGYKNEEGPRPQPGDLVSQSDVSAAAE